MDAWSVVPPTIAVNVMQVPHWVQVSATAQPSTPFLRRKLVYLVRALAVRTVPCMILLCVWPVILLCSLHSHVHVRKLGISLVMGKGVFSALLPPVPFVRLGRIMFVYSVRIPQLLLFLVHAHVIMGIIWRMGCVLRYASHPSSTTMASASALNISFRRTILVTPAQSLSVYHAA